MEQLGERTCIVTRRREEAPGALIRFVAAPDGSVVVDLKKRLPGRGCWVTADRLRVAEAVRKNLFARALRAEAKAAPDLADQVDALMAKTTLGSLGLARKAGALLLGAAQVESAVRSGKAIAVLHADDAAADGVRKIDQARRAVVHLGGPEIASYKLFGSADLGLALGAANVIHAALLQTDAGRAALKKIDALARYRGMTPEARNPAEAGGGASEEEME